MKADGFQQKNLTRFIFHFSADHRPEAGERSDCAQMHSEKTRLPSGFASFTGKSIVEGECL
jgi:hypothetical protein